MYIFKADACKLWKIEIDLINLNNCLCQTIYFGNYLNLKRGWLVVFLFNGFRPMNCKDLIGGYANSFV